MPEVYYWGKAPNIAEAARRIGYSRASLHAWKRDGCAAFLGDGSVDLSALADWLRSNCRGERSTNAEWAEALRANRLPETFPGGRDYACDVDSIHEQAMRVRELFEDDGHGEAAEKFWQLWREHVRGRLADFNEYLAKQGLAEPL